MCFVLDLNFFPNNIRFFSATSGCGGMGAKFSYLDFRMAASSPKDAPIHNPCPPFAVMVEKHVENYGTQVLSNIVNGKLQSIPIPLSRLPYDCPSATLRAKGIHIPPEKEVTYFAVQGIKYLDLMENYFSSAQFQIITCDWLSSV